MLDKVVDKSLYPDFDRKPTHVNALSRIPFSFHQKTGNQVIPLNMNREIKFQDLWFFRNNGLSPNLTQKVEYENYINLCIRERSEESIPNVGTWNIRQCIIRSMLLKPSHDARLAFVMDALYARENEAEIQAFFRGFKDYNEHQTQYQIEKAKEAIERGIKPMMCDTLRNYGICDQSDEECEYKKNIRKKYRRGWPTRERTLS